MKNTFIILMLIIPLWSNAQEENDWDFKDIQKIYKESSVKERAKLDSIFHDAKLDSLLIEIEQTQKEQQIKHIGGIPFGISQEEARPMLNKKFGKEDYSSDKNAITFNDIRYAGVDFNSVNFLFQSDGINSYLNTCIFVIYADTEKDAIEEQEKRREILSKKYQLSCIKDNNGRDSYGGGISPLWDGHWYNLENEHLTGIHTDIIDSNEKVKKATGINYAVRVIYGPYYYIKEEF